VVFQTADSINNGPMQNRDGVRGSFSEKLRGNGFSHVSHEFLMTAIEQQNAFACLEVVTPT